MLLNPSVTPGVNLNPITTLEQHEMPAVATQTAFAIDGTVAVPSAVTVNTPANWAAFLLAQHKRRRGN